MVPPAPITPPRAWAQIIPIRGPDPAAAPTALRDPAVPSAAAPSAVLTPPPAP
jgi:hypothetical protein